MKLDLNERHSIAGVLTRIKALGWEPATVIDVGVAMGTEGFYGVWPSATICLVDPVEENRVYMEQIQAKYPHVIVACVAASNHTGVASASINVDMGYAALAPPKDTTHWLVKRMRSRFKSLKRRILRQPRKVSHNIARKVAVTTLDDLVDEHDLRRPMIVKIDTDSHEREIL